MNWEGMEDNWKQIKDAVRARWGRLTDEDLEGIAGQRELLIGRIGEIYGSNRERVEADLRDWERHQEPIVPTGPAQ